MITGENKSKILTLFRMDFFGAAYSYNNETWHSYTLPKEGPKTI